MNHPGWEDWVEEARREIERLERRAQRAALSLEGANQRDLDYIRGWVDALKYTYKMPEAAGRRHEKWLLEELEEDS